MFDERCRCSVCSLSTAELACCSVNQPLSSFLNIEECGKSPLHLLGGSCLDNSSAVLTLSVTGMIDDQETIHCKSTPQNLPQPTNTNHNHWHISHGTVCNLQEARLLLTCVHVCVTVTALYDARRSPRNKGNNLYHLCGSRQSPCHMPTILAQTRLQPRNPGSLSPVSSTAREVPPVFPRRPLQRAGCN